MAGGIGGGRLSGAAPVPVRPAGGSAAAGWHWPPARIGTLALGLIMSRLTDAAAPWVDAGNAAWSMVAQLLTDRRHVESWPLWIGINIVSIWLYASQGLFADRGALCRVPVHRLLGLGPMAPGGAGWPAQTKRVVLTGVESTGKSTLAPRSPRISAVS